MSNLSWCPQSDSNRHWKDFKSSVSAIGLRGRQANLRLFTHKSHIYADISKDEEALHLVSVLKVCQLKNEVSGIPKFGSPPSLF